jgi:hypothetical protein
LLDSQKNNEIDLFASSGGNSIGEQMWIDYYADRGTFDRAVKLLRDTKLGWFEDHASHWKPPSDTGPVNLLIVVHDNRGGAAWARTVLCVDT